MGLGLTVRPVTGALGFRTRRVRVPHAHRESRIAILAILAAMVASIPALGVLAPFPVPLGAPANPAAGGDAVRLVGAYLLAGLPVWGVLVWRRIPPRSVSLRLENLGRGSAYGLLLGLIFTAATVGVAGPEPRLAAGDPGVWITLGMFFGVALVEETLFRGFLQLRLSWAVGPVRALLLAAVVMALFPLPFRLLFDPPVLGDALLASAIMLPASVFLGFLMMKTQNVMVPAITHAFIRWGFFLAAVPVAGSASVVG